MLYEMSCQERERSYAEQLKINASQFDIFGPTCVTLNACDGAPFSSLDKGFGRQALPRFLYMAVLVLHWSNPIPLSAHPECPHLELYRAALPDPAQTGSQANLSVRVLGKKLIDFGNEPLSGDANARVSQRLSTVATRTEMACLGSQTRVV